MRTLDGKVVVITGAASGIGRALALEVGGRGALVAVSDVDDAGLAATVARVEAAGVREIRSDRVDVADRAAMAAYAAEVAAHFGRVNVIVNNAGVSVSGDVTELSYEDLDWIVGINFWGLVHGTKEFLPHLIASGDGHVVNLSSLFGLVSVPGQSAYNATKYAVRGFSEALREEMLVAGHPVGVTVVHPGGIRTDIVRNSRVSGLQDKATTVRLFDEKLAKMTPQRAAQIIAKAVLADQPRLLVGLDAHLLHHVARLMGARYQDLFAAVSKRTLLPPRT